MKNVKITDRGRFGNIILEICEAIYRELYPNTKSYINFLLTNDHLHKESLISPLNMLFNNEYIKIYNSEQELLKNQNILNCNFIEYPNTWTYFSLNHNPELYTFLDHKIPFILNYINVQKLLNQYSGIYQTFKNSLVIHLRLTDYLAPSNKQAGFQTLNVNYIKEMIRYIHSSLKFRGKIYVITDDISLAQIYLYSLIKPHNIYNIEFHTYNNFFMDWLSLYFSKYIIGSASTFSLTAGILGYAKKVYIPYPYLSTVKLPNIDYAHEFLYHNSKIIKTNINSSNIKNIIYKS